VDLGFLALLACSVVLALRSRLRNMQLSSGWSHWLRLERPLLALVLLLCFLQIALPRLDRYGKMLFLAGGQDWLSYETFARDIQFNGPLMPLGKPLGQGAVYVNQPLYPYFLAVLHGLAGEDFYGVLALQVLGLGVCTLMIYEISKRLFGRAAALFS